MARGRKPSHRIRKAHPHKRFSAVITMLNYRRGPDDDMWGAAFKLDGKWTPKDGVSLGTRDWDDAVEIAREKYILLTNGVQVTKARAPPKPAGPEHAFSIYAQRAIDKLETQARAAESATPGKGHNYLQAAGRVRVLNERWSGTDIKKLTDDALNHWIEFEYRVEDRAATVKLYGRQPRNAARQKVLKRPGVNTVGNLDAALLAVWTEAVADRIVERRQRPMIDRSLGEDAEPRAFIDTAGLKAVASVMSDEWVSSPEKHSPDLKLLLRAYVSMLSSTGIRPGLEAKRIRIGDVHFETQHGRAVIFIRVVPNQGKHPKARSVIVYEGGSEFNVRRLLRELIAWRESHHAGKNDSLFAYPDGSAPLFRDALDTVLKIANAEVDPDSGERRTAYSFRHYFATKLIELGQPVPFIAAWLGTSSQMIEKFYNKFLIEQQAHRVNGINPWVHMMSETGRTDPALLSRVSATISNEHRR